MTKWSAREAEALATIGVLAAAADGRRDETERKRLAETFSKWNREDALGDVVRIIRTSRPWIILSRFQGNERDGHGNHSAAGVLAAAGPAGLRFDTRTVPLTAITEAWTAASPERIVFTIA